MPAPPRSLDQPTLAGAVVALEPLQRTHVDDLLRAADLDRSTYRFTWVPTDRDGMASYVDELLAQRAAGTALPYVQRRVDDQRVVGCTRFMNLVWWSGRDVPDEVEIGGTWLAADAQRSAVNTAAKLLLLGHAFDHWQVHRVALCTDARNTRSRAAIERLGASFEGVLRAHRASYVAGEEGTARDSAMFSVTRHDWPAVRAGLQERLGG